MTATTAAQRKALRRAALVPSLSEISAATGLSADACQRIAAHMRMRALEPTEYEPPAYHPPRYVAPVARRYPPLWRPKTGPQTVSDNRQYVHSPFPAHPQKSEAKAKDKPQRRPRRRLAHPLARYEAALNRWINLPPWQTEDAPKKPACLTRPRRGIPKPPRSAT